MQTEFVLAGYWYECLKYHVSVALLDELEAQQGFFQGQHTVSVVIPPIKLNIYLLPRHILAHPNFGTSHRQKHYSHDDVAATLKNLLKVTVAQGAWPQRLPAQPRIPMSHRKIFSGRILYSGFHLHPAGSVLFPADISSPSNPSLSTVHALKDLFQKSCHFKLQLTFTFGTFKWEWLGMLLLFLPSTLHIT